MTDGLLFRRDYLEKYKINLYEGELPTKLNLNSPEENMMYNLISSFNQYENEQRRKKSQQGKIYKLTHQSQTKSVYMGGTSLFGYINKNKEWTINKEEEKWVKYL